MTTLTIELSEADARIAEETARLANMTLTEWAALRIVGRSCPPAGGELDEKGYPIGWFERHAGALADVEDFCEPEDRPAPPIEPLEL